MPDTADTLFPDNILLWPDGFWCFRDELNANFLRGDDYTVVLHQSDQWKMIKSTNPAAPSKTIP